MFVVTSPDISSVFSVLNVTHTNLQIHCVEKTVVIRLVFKRISLSVELTKGQGILRFLSQVNFLSHCTKWLTEYIYTTESKSLRWLMVINQVSNWFVNWSIKSIEWIESSLSRIVAFQIRYWSLFSKHSLINLEKCCTFNLR